MLSRHKNITDLTKIGPEVAQNVISSHAHIIYGDLKANLDRVSTSTTLLVEL